MYIIIGNPIHVYIYIHMHAFKKEQKKRKTKGYGVCKERLTTTPTALSTAARRTPKLETE